MTIEEAIAHCYDVAKGKDNQCDDCKNEHLQLAKWLEENKRMKELLKQAVEDFKTTYVLGDNCYNIDCEICPYREYVKEEEFYYCSCGRWNYADEVEKLLKGE